MPDGVQGWDITQDPVHRYTKPGDTAVTVPGLPYQIQLARLALPYLYPEPMSEWGFKRVIPNSTTVQVAPKGVNCPHVITPTGKRQAILPAFLYE